MNNLMSTALVMSGIFVVCYPVMLFFLNHIMDKMENEANEANGVA